MEIGAAYGSGHGLKAAAWCHEGGGARMKADEHGSGLTAVRRWCREKLRLVLGRLEDRTMTADWATQEQRGCSGLDRLRGAHGLGIEVGSGLERVVAVEKRRRLVSEAQGGFDGCLWWLLGHGELVFGFVKGWLELKEITAVWLIWEL
ncbi:hypothetical protein M0R45_026287 [Rubus argutus]|uniref:Uncharacterized protein n=1 Tax=Rubus argutus TaxID=59490 RepID=A0AAW1WYV9_RUBAR